jgi:hypothetical protein
MLYYAVRVCGPFFSTKTTLRNGFQSGRQQWDDKDVLSLLIKLLLSKSMIPGQGWWRCWIKRLPSVIFENLLQCADQNKVKYLPAIYDLHMSKNESNLS